MDISDLQSIYRYNGETLCAKCQAIRFDEATLGGEQYISETGEAFLTFPKRGHSKKKELRLPYSVKDIFPGLPALHVAADCVFCSFLRTTIQGTDIRSRLEDRVLQYSGEDLPIMITFCYYWGQWPVFGGEGLGFLKANVMINVENLESLEGELVVDFDLHLTASRHADSRNDLCADWLKLRSPRERNPMTPEKVEWMQSHLSQCCEGKDGHMACGGDVIYNAELPTRLIDLRKPTPRLVRTSELEYNPDLGIPHYVALSYCWGDSADSNHQLKTLVETERGLMEEIPVSKVTKTIQDAIEITRALAIPFLWVDALCIIQNDRADWEKEASRMHQVYGNAHITVCSLFESCRATMCSRDHVDLNIPFRSSIRPDVEGIFVLQYEGYSMGGGGATLSAPHAELKSSRWIERGWTHQEFILSSRALVFGQSFVHFICPSIVATEDTEKPREQADIPWVFFLPDIPSDPDEVYKAWTNVISSYSSRQFTNSLDVLPALSGLALRFSETLGDDEYVSGLWKRDLIRELMWIYSWWPGSTFTSLESLLAELVSSTGRVTAPNMPSWTWAGRQGVEFPIHDEIGIPLDSFHAECDLTWPQDAVRTERRNQFIGVTGHAELKVLAKTYTLPQTLINIGNDSTEYFGVQFILEDTAFVDCNFDWRIEKTRGDETLERELRLLLLGSAVNSSDGIELGEGENEEGNRVAYGLIVCEAEEKVGFRRVGAFRLKPADGERSKGGLASFKRCPTESLTLL